MNSTPESHQPVQPEEQYVPEIDSLLSAQNLNRILWHPGNYTDEAVHQGFDGDPGQLHAMVQEKRRQALTDIAAPAVIAEMGRISERRTAEEMDSGLRTVLARLNAIEETLAAVNRGVEVLNDQVHSAKYTVRMLEEMIYSQRLSPDEMLMASRKLRTFGEEYVSAQRGINAAYQDTSQEVMGASYSAEHAAEAAENGRRHFVKGRNDIEDNPDNAWFDTLPEAVEGRGATTVAEHKQSCEREATEHITNIADMRDDAEELRVDLAQMAHRLAGTQAIESMPNANNLVYLIDQINTMAYRSQDGSLNPHVLEQVVAELSHELRRAERAGEDVAHAKRQDIEQIDTIRQKTQRIISTLQQ